MTASVNGRELSRGNAGQMYWTWPQLLAHASRDTELRPGDVLGSGTVGTGCILELTPEAVGRLAQAGRRGGTDRRAAGDLAQPRRPTSLVGNGPCNRRNPHASLSPTRLPPAEAAHRPSHEPGYRGEGIYYEEVVTTAGSAGRTASSTTCGRRPASARSSRPGRCRSSSSTEPALRHHHLKIRQPPAGRRSRHRPRAAVGQRRRDDRPLPAGPAARRSCTATPPPTRSSSSITGQGDAAHDVRPAAVPAVRLRRHPALHDLPPRVRPAGPSPTCSSSRRPARVGSRRST